MSNRWLGGFIQGGNFNPLGSQTTSYTYGIWGAGNNNAGQLGNNESSIYRSSPVQAGSLTTWASASASQNNTSIAIKSDGTMWSWGSGAAGASGQGTTDASSSPIQIGGITRYVTLGISSMNGSNSGAIIG